MRIDACLTRLGLPAHHPLFATDDSISALLAGLLEFREHLGGTLTITMLRGIGEGFEVHEIDSALMRRAATALA